MMDPRDFGAALLDPEPVQRDVLARLLARNAGTVYGRDHAFADCRSYEDYAARVPAASYEQLEPYVERIAGGEANILVSDPVVYMATSSGTTGRKKYVAIQPGYLEETERWMAIERHFLDAEHPELAGADELRYVNRVEGRLPSGMPIGSVSGWFYGELERAGRYAELVPYAVYQLAPTVGRNYTVLRFALAARFGRLSAVNPSTLLLLAQRLEADAEALVRDVRDGGLRHAEVPEPLRAELAGRLPADPTRARELEQAIARHGGLNPAGAWPELRLLCCWIHAGAGLYRRDLEQAFGPLPVWDYGYTSSEGRVTVTARADGAGVPLLDLVFLELRGADGQVRPLFAVDGGEGELLVTNSRGLYRYAMGDRVEVVGRLGRTPLLRFRGKTTAVASLTGEKLTEEHVVGAVEASLAELRLRARYFCLAPEWGAPPRYLLLLDPASWVSDGVAARLALEVERRLIAGNTEYERKRETLRLRELGVYLLEDGELERYQSRLLGQGRELARLKLPRISMDVDLVRQFRGRVIEPTQ
jgi:hypothetical protein